MKTISIIVIGMGVSIPPYVYIKSMRQVDRPVVSIPEVRISPDQCLVEQPQLMAITTGHFIETQSHKALHGPWPQPAVSQQLHCSVDEKDLLFALLWGSTITPPKS